MKKQPSLLDLTRSKSMVKKARFLRRFMEDRVIYGGWFVTRIWAFRYVYLSFLRRGYTEVQSASAASQHIEKLVLAGSV